MNSNELTRQILNLVRKGRILAVDHQAALCRVVSGELQTNWIPWLAFAAGATRDWNPPTVDEQVLLVCAGGDPAEGVALCGIYSKNGTAPSDKATNHVRLYPDGAFIEYDHADHVLTATLPAGAKVLVTAPAAVEVHTTSATIVADQVTLDTPKATVTGDLEVRGAITAGNDITTPADIAAGNISLKKHKHLEQGDGKPTGSAQA